MSVTPQHIRDVFARYCDLLTAGDFEAIAMLYAPDGTVEDPIGATQHVGRDAIREFYRSTAGTATLRLDGPVRPAGNEGAAALIATPIGAPNMRVEIIDVMSFNYDGLITSMRAYWSADTIFTE